MELKEIRKMVKELEELNWSIGYDDNKEASILAGGDFFDPRVKKHQELVNKKIVKELELLSIIDDLLKNQKEA